MKLIAFCLLASMALIASAAESNPDEVFFQSAARSALSEIAAGELALQQASSGDLKNLAAAMVKDHTAALATVRALAAGKEVDLPTVARPEDAAKLSSLRSLSGVGFDKAYIEWQIGAHQDAIALFKAESTSGDDVEGRQFAVATLPTLRAHLDHLFAVVTSSPPTAQ